ncbi:tyrosine-type recombinase/integrase [Hymenobacter monticola]|uniref:Tyrosine-type recombinase/integrase n=1 Tax=Hymenobacter monticola TaxID=1705399 RepID=A0ABY4BBW5_9BACT|nr:tyrosine-type recombinase/integrase [Hymenobacter monticola]UOE36649.1 tyrosine-type recombinase/integrase [Hymenobacter monticola]
MNEQKGKKEQVAVVPASSLAEMGEALAAHVGRYFVEGLHGADNTRLAYSADLKSFEAYCEANALTPYPADAATLAAYIAHLADLPRKLATIRRHLAAIQKKHELHGHPSAVGSKPVETVLRGIGRVVGKKQKQAPAFTVEALKQAIRGLDLTTPVGLRDRAILLLGFAGAFRRSELVALNVEALEYKNGALVLHLDKSKTNQQGETEDKAVFYAPTPLFCPIRACEEWLAVLGRTSGPLFVSMVRAKPGQPGRPGARRLTDGRLNSVVKAHLGDKYSAHSLRASFITVAVLNGQSNNFIKNQTKQKTDEMISRYTRLTDVIAYNAAQSLGL